MRGEEERRKPADTVSARLGANACTIDVHLPDVAERDLVRVEDLVNAVVMDDVPVRALFPTDEELRAHVPVQALPRDTQRAGGRG